MPFTSDADQGFLSVGSGNADHGGLDLEAACLEGFSSIRLAHDQWLERRMIEGRELACD